ncbi:hypothetical protein HF086_006447, partial [Spodoptera exigua]
VLWLPKNMILLTSLSVKFEKFYMTVEEVKIACILFLKDNNCSRESETDYHITHTSAPLIFCWLVKNLLLLIIIILQCEKFYTVLEDSQDICALVMKSKCPAVIFVFPEENKKLCRNVRRLHRASFCKIRACYLFNVDVCLLLHLIELLANHTIILLQFAFV